MRIASLSPALTEILFELGLGRDIVCSDQWSDMPDEAKELPHLKGHQDIALEELQSYQPEVVLTETLVQEKLAQALKPHFAVKHFDPRTLGEIYDTIVDLGSFFERTKQARELIQNMQSEFAVVKKKAALLPSRARVYIEEWHHPPMVSGNWVPEVVKISGGESFPLAERAPSREVTLAEVQEFNPALIILSICGAGRYASPSLLTSRPGWAELPAVKAHHLFVIDDSMLNRPGRSLVEGAQRLYSWIFEVLH